MTSLFPTITCHFRDTTSPFSITNCSTSNTPFPFRHFVIIFDQVPHEIAFFDHFISDFTTPSPAHQFPSQPFRCFRSFHFAKTARIPTSCTFFVI